jgi:long-chain acyl-CoA synthetase
MASSGNEILDVTNNTSSTYQEILSSALEFGASLKIEKQSTVSVVLPNSDDYLIAYLACVLYGFIFAPVPHFLTQKEIEKAVEYHNSVVLITDREDLTFTVPTVKVTKAKSIRTFEESAWNLPLLTEDDILCLYYSSGTTGDPKGVLYSHGNKFSLISSISDAFNFKESTRHLAFLPFGHTAALNYSVFPSLLVGGPLVIASSFEKIRSRFFSMLSEHRIQYVQIVPTVAQTLIKLKEDISTLDMSHLEYIGCGSAPLSISIQENFEKLFGLPLANLYGLSETGPSHFDDPNSKDWIPGSIGVPLSVNECKIAPDGEILLRGANVMKGYFKNEEQTRKVLVDGWFHTGDYGYEENGRYFFLDRKKDLVIVGGINVYPAEIEDILYSSNLLSECVVFGVPDRTQGEKIIASVVLKDQSIEHQRNCESELISHCRKHLSTFKIPSRILVIDAIPKTASGKLIRREVRESYLLTLLSTAD